MAEYENFDRQYRLAAGGFEIGETTREKPLAPHVNFSLQKTDLESQNTGKLSVWNLSPEHLAALNQTGGASPQPVSPPNSDVTILYFVIAPSRGRVRCYGSEQVDRG